MIARLKESPSFRKLFRNRGAVVAMSVIAVYLAAFAWILLMQGVAEIGRSTGSFDLRQRPVMGALLPSRTLERVGPRNLSGLGIRSAPDLRSEQMRFYYDLSSDAINDLAKASTLPEPEAEKARAEARKKAALAERTLADLPLAELESIRGRAQAAFDTQNALRTLRGQLLKLSVAIDSVREHADAVRALPADADAADALDELSLSLEEIGFLIEDLRAGVAPDSPLGSLDPDAFADAAERVLDDPRPDPLYDAPALDAVEHAVTSRRAELDAEITGTLATIEPIIDELYPMPTGTEGFIYKARLLLGTDRQGRSILTRAVYSAKVAIQVGVVVSVIAVAFGSLIGAAAGYFGSWADHLVIWLYSTFSSIPYLVLLVVLAFMFTGSKVEGTLIPLYTAFCLTYWIGPCRVTRGEALKLKALDYVQAANALGASKSRILIRHIIPNTAHLMFINLSLLFIGAIKGEVVLTFLGLGLKDGASWGIMIDQSRSEVVSGFFWQIGAATGFMFVLVLAFNVFTDALQDAFDPKHVG